MKKLISIFAMAALVVSMASCTDDTENGSGDGVDLKPIPIVYSQVQQTEFAQRSNKFANKLMTVLSADPDKQDENVCVAPMSMQYMFSILANGVNEALQNEIVNALGFDDIESLNQENLALLDKLEQDDEFVKVGLNNSTWLAKEYTYLPEFKSTIEGYYKAQMGIADISGNPIAMQEQIDKWAKDNTRGLITNFPLKINDQTKIIALNANYFDGKWSHPFKPSNTKAQPFYGVDGQPRNVMTMSNTAEVNHYVDESLQMVELPYGQGYYSMMVVMPKRTECLPEIIEHADWWAWHNLMTKSEAMVCLPRFSAMTDWGNLINKTADLGMPSAFGAGFPKVAENLNAALMELAHKVAIRVDENGTKAAATSAGLGIDIAPGPTPYLPFDHPFIYAIRENTTGAILFMGRVVEP